MPPILLYHIIFYLSSKNPVLALVKQLGGIGVYKGP